MINVIEFQLQEQCEKLQRDIRNLLVGIDDDIIDTLCNLTEERFQILKDSLDVKL